MRSTIRPSSRPSRLQNQGGVRLISRRLTLWLVLLSLGAALVLSSVLVDARSERRSATRTGQKQATKPIAGVLNESRNEKPWFKNGNAQYDPGGAQQQNPSGVEQTAQARSEGDRSSRKPKEERLNKAHSFTGDLRDLPYRKPVKRERPEREEPEPHPTLYAGTSAMTTPAAPSAPSVPAPSAPAPATLANFDGLDFATFGAGHPPDTNGDVGPTYYIQTVNTSIGIFRKSDGVRVAAFTFNTFMSQGNFGNLCDTNNFGDPVVLYDSFEDRWIITDFAFSLDGSNSVIHPPGSFQCIAASKTGDPVSGGWNFYSINTTGGLGDYPKFGIWPDGLYMSVNMFDYAAGGSFQNARVYAFNKAQMYAGAPAVQSVSFEAPAAEFSLLPSNARLQTGTPPSGRPNYFVSTWQFLNALTVYKFHVDWNRISASTFTGPDVPLAGTSWPNASVPNAPSLGGNNLDVLEIRAMMQNQYSNIGGAESLWTTHTVRRGNTTGFAAPRWYQVDVTGGSVAANLPQAATWDPDGANVIHRFMPSLAVDRIGDMALGYSTSSSTTKPAIKYAGRLATDPINTLSQTEQVLIQGAGTQTGSCGGTCTRWGDYSAMSLDPDGCTFWYTNEYYAVDGLNDLTRVGSFAFPQCTPVGNGGTVSGTVTDSATSNPISGAAVALGSRTTTTNPSGVYTFSNLPAGTYPSITASFVGHSSSTATSVVVTDGGTTTQNFSLITAPVSGCSVDTSQADFQTGVLTNVDLTTSPGDVKLADLGVETTDQVSSPAALSSTGNLTATAWTGQTFRAGITGNLTKISVGLGLASGSSGTITVEIRDLSGANPGTTVLATGTLGPVTNVGTAAFYTTTFPSPAAVVSGTSYSVVLRTSVGNTVFGVRGSTAGGSTLANGQVFTTSNSGTVWTAIPADLWFTTYVTPPLTYSASGNLVSGLKDANPAAGLVPHWLTLSWTATTPANTTVQFRAAASNNIDGPFNFVGPDGTAATFFTTSGASLSQFNGFRYLKYEALLSTTDSTVTPTVNNVTACFDNDTPVITAAAPLSRQQGATPINAQIATVSDPIQAANTLSVTAAPLTGTGVTINNISIDVAGNVTADVAASCTATNSTFTLTVTNNTSGTATTTLTVNVTSTATPTITPGGPTTFCSGGSVTLTSSSASGNQWYLNSNPIGGATGQQYIATATGSYTVTANSCNPSAATAVTVNPFPAKPTITPGGPTTFCAGGSVTLTSSSASGNQWYLNGNPIGGATNQSYLATASGAYTVTVTTSGCTSAPSTATTATVNAIPATPTITPGGPTTFFAGASVTLTSSSASGNQWHLNGNPIGGATARQYIATTSGNYTVTATTSGCTSAPSAARAITVNPPPTTPTITKSFSPTSIPLNTNSTLSFTITNPNSNVILSNVSASDTLPTGLVVANPSNVAGSCAADITATPGSNTIAITKLNLPASSSCSFSVNVTGTTLGNKNNISGNVTASYDDGTGNLVPIIGGTATATIQVLKGNQTITFGALPNKTFGDADFIVGATASSGLPVSVTAAGNCTVSGAVPTVHLTGAGSCTVTASQGGNIDYNAATNVVHSFNISQAATTTALSSSINPSDIGQNVTFTAAVTPPSNTSTPSGMVQFKDGLNDLGSAVACIASLSNTCTAQVSTSTLTTGTHAISVIYSGDTNFVGSSGSLSGGQVVTSELALLLILEEIGPNPNQATALDSLLLLRDPFPIHSIAEWFNFGPDRNTRVMVFVANLQLNPGETNSAVVVSLIDSNNQNHDVQAEDVRLDPITGFTRVTFRLPDTLFPGTCTVQVKAHGHVSNSALIRIGP